MDDAAFLERELELDGGVLPVRFYTPSKAPGGEFQCRYGPRTIVLADNAYDADRIRELIQDQGATPIIPPESDSKRKPCFGKRLYQKRNLIARFFSKLRHFRRVAARHDKLAANFLAMVQLASTAVAAGS